MLSVQEGSQQDLRNFVSSLNPQPGGVSAGPAGREKFQQAIAWCEQWTELAVDDGLLNLHPRDYKGGHVASWGKTDDLIDAGVGIRIAATSVGSVEVFYIQDTPEDDALPITYRVFATNPDALAAMGYSPTVIKPGRVRDDAPYHQSAAAPVEPTYPNWQSLTRQEQNVALRQHGYRWVKITQDWLDANDDFWTTPGWHLYSSDRREVDVAQAFDEINRGVEVVRAEIEAKRQAEEAECRRRREIKAQVAAIAEHIRQHGERPESRNFPQGETLFDTRNIYGGGDAFIIEPDQTLWYLKNNGADGDNWSYNNLPGHIGYRLAPNENLANTLRQLAGQTTKE